MNAYKYHITESSKAQSANSSTHFFGNCFQFLPFRI